MPAQQSIFLMTDLSVRIESEVPRQSWKGNLHAGEGYLIRRALKKASLLEAYPRLLVIRQA
jgi:hypothetical protein